MRKVFYSVTLLTLLAFTGTAQTNMEMKKKFNFMQRFHSTLNFSNQNQRLGLKIDPYWEDVNAPHTYNSYMPQIKVPTYNSVWALIDYDSVNSNKTFLHTANGGKSWLLDTVEAPAGYVLGTISAIDANTCYASMINGNMGLALGGGIYKTTDGGYHWHQLAKGKIFDSTSFPDFVYFFDARNGFSVGDNNGDTSRLEIYTTSDAGATWVRVPKADIPPTIGSAHSFSFNVYSAFENRFWFLGYDDQGNGYTYRSDDLGHHWKLFKNNSLGSLYAYAFTDKQNGLGVSFDNNGAVYVVATHDGGETWASKSYTGYPNGGFLTVIPGTHTYVSTLPSGFTPVYGSSYSNDYGATWKIIDSGVNAEHTAVEFLNPFIGWTGSAGYPLTTGGMYKWKLHFSLDDKAIAADNENASALTKNDLTNTINVRLYPNPAKDVLAVTGLNASAKTTLSLYSISGKLIQQSISNGDNYQFNIQNLAAGSYYIKIQSGEKTTTLKFVKE